MPDRSENGSAAGDESPTDAPTYVADPAKALARLGAIFAACSPFEFREVREHLAKMWAALLHTAAQAVEREPNGALTRLAARKVFDLMVHQAIWSVTEVHSAAGVKYMRSTFMSEDAVTAWRRAAGKQVRPPVGEFKKGLRFEHVEQVADVAQNIRGCSSVEEIQQVLASIPTCIVSEGEHTRLAPHSKLRAWRRYEEANINVYRADDEGNFQPVDLASLGSASADEAKGRGMP